MEKLRAFGDGTLLDKIFENWDKIMDLFACFTALGSPAETAAQVLDDTLPSGKRRRMRRRLKRPNDGALGGAVEILKQAEGGKRKRWRKRLRGGAGRLTNDECDRVIMRWAETVEDQE